MKIGIFGGSFDPIHLGHLLIAQSALEQESLDTVVFIPAFNPPHKDSIVASFDHRYNMIFDAIKDNDKFKVDECESYRDDISYTIDTLRGYKLIYRSDDLYLILGSDSYYHGFVINTWKYPDEIRLLVKDIIVYPRQQYDIFGKCILLNNHIPFQSSSTEIRKYLKEKSDIPKYLLHSSTYNYIQKHDLYR